MYDYYPQWMDRLRSNGGLGPETGRISCMALGLLFNARFLLYN